MYVSIVTRAYLNCARQLNNLHFGGAGKENGLGTSTHVGLRRGGNMSASAREAGSPRPVADEAFDGSSNEYASLEEAASTKGPLADGLSAPKAAQRPAPDQNPTRQDDD